MTNANIEGRYRVWRSGDDLMLVISDVGVIELSRDDALALATEISGSYAPAIPGKRRHSTAEERAEVCRLYQEERMPASEIARQRSMNVATIYQILHRGGISAHDQKKSARVKRQMAKRRAA